MKKLVFLTLLILVPLSARAADAQKFDWTACAKEIKEFGCKGTDKEVWQCLEKNDPKLSETCDKTHEKGDKIFGEE